MSNCCYRFVIVLVGSGFSHIYSFELLSLTQVLCGAFPLLIIPLPGSWQKMFSSREALLREILFIRQYWYKLILPCLSMKANALCRRTLRGKVSGSSLFTSLIQRSSLVRSLIRLTSSLSDFRLMSFTLTCL